MGLENTSPCTNKSCEQLADIIEHIKKTIELLRRRGAPEYDIRKQKRRQAQYEACQSLKCLELPKPPTGGSGPGLPTSDGLPQLPPRTAPPTPNPNPPSAGCQILPSAEELEIFYNSGAKGFPPGPKECPVPEEKPLSCPDAGIPGVISSPFGGDTGLCQFIINPKGPTNEQIRIIFPANDPSSVNLAIEKARSANAGLGLEKLKQGIETGAIIVKGTVEFATGTDDAEVILKAGFDPTIENLTTAGFTLFIGYAAYRLLKKSPAPGAGRYSHLTDPPTVGAGKDFTAAQKAKIIEANKVRNGGVVKSDLSGKRLTRPQKSKKGMTPDPNEWQIDHINPKHNGGTNSYCNAQVLSRSENRAKSNTPPN